MAEKKKATKTRSTAASKVKKEVKQQPQEDVYSFEELAKMFGISKMKARAYFNMSQLDYGQKITIKKARELFNKFQEI